MCKAAIAYGIFLLSIRPHSSLFVPEDEYPDIIAYIVIFIGAVYRYEHLLATEKAEYTISITQLLLSLFEG